MAGWLQRHCQELTGLKTTSVKKLVFAVEHNAPHASEAVGLYALSRGRGNDLAKYVQDESLAAEWKALIGCFAGEQVVCEEAIHARYALLPVRYRRVVDLYDGIEADRENDRHVKGLMAQKVSAALERAGITRYRLCRDLGLNEGNIYAWLAGDPSKVSRETARRAWQYAENAARSS